MQQALSDGQKDLLREICDTFVPKLDHEPDPHGLWARTASQTGADVALGTTIESMPPEQFVGFCQLLEAIEAQGFSTSSRRSREQILKNLSLMGGDAAVGVRALQGLTMFFAYGLPTDPATGKNPNWDAFGYPGPVAAPPQVEKPIHPVIPEGDRLELEADVVIVGSGAGGGVIAGTLAKQGLKVVVVEAGNYLNESDFQMLEIPAFMNSYWRGGPTPTADMNVSIQAGAGLGGGTVINWTNCLKTRPWVRDQWANEFGLEGVDGSEYDRHLDSILTRIMANDECSDLNLPQQRMQAGAEELGWSFEQTTRNTDPATYDPLVAGFMGFGDPSGSKQSTLATYLLDAFNDGADIIVNTSVRKVMTEGGRAAGIEGVWTDASTGRTAEVIVRAGKVVVACGSVESPALLLRSGIGGPAVGKYLRLHPCTAVMGRYSEDMKSWWGAPHAGLVDEFADTGDGWGWLIEGAQYTTAVSAAAVPFTTAEDHKRVMSDFSNTASFIGLLRDRGHGTVSIDANGEAVHHYSITDEVDIRNSYAAIESQIRLHAAAGAETIVSLAEGLPDWRHGDDLETFITRCRRMPLRAGGQRLFSAHQMGSCRMGTDPAESVAGPWGELHDTPGVWIGDASAFPTASGTNPMVSVMALAHRTAEAISQITDDTPTLAKRA
ncbi:MAG: GMC family oxidoreductase [Solirubrobacterales bacterium]|nr:GMC family oxidoreductase [Solirubrobacterales bacterium]